MRKHDRLRRALAWAVVFGGLAGAFVAAWFGGVAEQSAFARQREASDRMLCAVTDPNGKIFEVREYRPDLGTRAQLASGDKRGPGGNGVPSLAFYVVRRSDGEERSLLWTAYVTDWGARLLPVGASPAYCAAVAVDANAAKVHVVVTGSLPGSCLIEDYAFDADGPGTTYDGASPFPENASAPVSAWPSGIVSHASKEETSGRAYVTTPRRAAIVRGVSLLSDEGGLLLYCRTGFKAHVEGVPMYVRRTAGEAGWKKVSLVESEE